MLSISSGSSFEEKEKSDHAICPFRGRLRTTTPSAPLVRKLICKNHTEHTPFPRDISQTP